ncbi:MAG: hypothetical protein ABGW85_06635 [Sulfurimonas sp.]
MVRSSNGTVFQVPINQSLDSDKLKPGARVALNQDTLDDIKTIVDTVLTRKGGDGAVREMIDILIEENDEKERFLSLWIKE